jgi:hypothetical protein
LNQNNKKIHHSMKFEKISNINFIKFNTYKRYELEISSYYIFTHDINSKQLLCKEHTWSEKNVQK